MTLRAVVSCVLLVSLVGWGHDLSLDVTGTLTTSSANNPRAGSAGVGLSGAYDLSDALSLTGFAAYTRDLATKTAESSSEGGNVLLFGLGAMWLPSAHLMTALTAVGSPPSAQRNSLTVPVTANRSADVVIDSSTWSLGGVWNGLWTSGALRDLEHTVDVTLGLNTFTVSQALEVPDTVRGRILTSFCEGPRGRTVEACALVGGTRSTLIQGRLGLGYTATLFGRTDLGLEASYFLYNQPPSEVGYFSVVSVGRIDLGAGVPVLPLLLSARAVVSHRFSLLTLKASYQYGHYTESLGALHVASVRGTVKLGAHWRLWLAVTGQLDVASGAVTNPGGLAVLGTMYVW